MEKQAKAVGFETLFSAEDKASLESFGFQAEANSRLAWGLVNTKLYAWLDGAAVSHTAEWADKLKSALSAWVKSFVGELSQQSANAAKVAQAKRDEQAKLMSLGKLTKAQARELAALPDAAKAADDEALRLKTAADGLGHILATWPLVASRALFWGQALPLSRGVFTSKLMKPDNKVPEAERAAEFERRKSANTSAKQSDAERTVQNTVQSANPIFQARVHFAAAISLMRKHGFVELASEVLDVITDYIPSFSESEANLHDAEAIQKIAEECKEALEAAKQADKALI